MHRILAIIERDLRRFRRSPALIMISMMMPLTQLIILGYAFGGKVKNLSVGLVDEDRTLASVQLREMFQAVEASAKTFKVSNYSDRGTALADLKKGHINSVLLIPPLFSRNLLAGAEPTLALLSDNTDQFASSALHGTLSQLIASYQQKPGDPRLSPKTALAVVELYPYIPYIQYLLPGTIVLAVFLSAMIGGGIILIDDKARGLHEGYLVTPIRKYELILGFTMAGAIKAILSGIILVTVGSLIAGIHDPLNVLRFLRMLLLVILTAFALISMMFLLMVRVNDPLIPRAIFGVLNTVLFFPSGAVYPIEAFPKWMKVIANVDPFTYAVHGFKSLLLKNTGLIAIWQDLVFLAVFTLIAMVIATKLFRRTL